MHISFINPILGGDYSATDIAITYLATYINKRTGHSASIIDLAFHRQKWRDYLRAKIIKYRPDIIGLSTNTMYMQYVKTVMREVKKEYGLPIILGGHHASIYPEQTIAIPECDAVYTGDGELSISDYLDNFQNNSPIGNIAGIWVKRNGRIVKNTAGRFNSEIDSLPYPDWDLWEDLDKYFYFLGMLYVIGSRGCPYRCSYCDAHGISDALGGDYFRMRNPDDYVRELEYHWSKYKNRNLRLFQMFDPVFTINGEWLEKFCQGYRKSSLIKKIKYSIFARIDNLNETKLKLLSSSGCALLRIGIECGNEHNRKNIYKKSVSNRQIESIFQMAKYYNIAITAFYILGGPGETVKSIKETISFADKIKAERSAFFIYKPFTQEGISQIYQMGGRVDKQKWAKSDNITFQAAIYTKELSPKQIESYQRLAYIITFGKRLISMIARQNIKYFIRLLIYTTKGIINGLDIKYLLTYYHIYGYDNIDR